MSPFEAHCGDQVRNPDGTVLTVTAYEGSGRLHCRNDETGQTEIHWPDDLKLVVKPVPKPVKAEPFVW